MLGLSITVNYRSLIGLYKCLNSLAICLWVINTRAFKFA
ncbi:hypothetical protein GCHA_3190 [Paraglaciecola chathamensis S18K6]|uniref:Transposase n=1 Tax=Paraglaciecola chathamensis S18K6 TaxID=1127672 RepID=A0AAV3V2U3_9ALTE|nr:hypothetical protein GCHA_3190 [Paraglaciecola chathamensis S18K6]